jgi:tetratricopeptide (TPR) repeat protein
MTKSNFIFLCMSLLILLWFSGCKEQETSSFKLDAIESRNLLDSIKLLDSLTIRNRIGNPSVAKSFARKSLQMAKKANSPEAFAIALNAMGNACNPAMKDSAFYYYSLAVSMADSNHLHDKLPGMMLNLAMLYIYAANYPVAAGMLDSIVTMAEKYRIPVVLADAHHALGMVRMAVFDSAGAKKSYETALEIGKANGLYRICGNALANLALFSRDPATVSLYLFQALGFYQRITGVDEEKAQLFVNIANMQANADSAIHYNNLSLEIAGREVS